MVVADNKGRGEKQGEADSVQSIFHASTHSVSSTFITKRGFSESYPLKQ